MSDKEKTDVTELLTAAAKVPEDKRDYLLGYMQCMVDMNEHGKDEHTKAES